MKIIAFDLSLKCTGVAVAHLKNSTILSLRTTSIVPLEFSHNDISKLGYLHSKKKITSKSGEVYYSYVKYNGECVSKAEKKKRDVEVRNMANTKKKQSLAIGIEKLVNTIRPDIILVERNESFNGILTTKLLAEARGILDGVAQNIPVQQYSVSEMRKKFSLAEMTKEFINKIKDSNSFPKDVTKSVLKDYVDRKYDIHTNNTDESDACIIFDHYYETVIKSGGN